MIAINLMLRAGMSQGCSNTVRNALLEKGAKPDHQNRRGESGLSWAARQGNLAIVALLLKWGAE